MSLLASYLMAAAGSQPAGSLSGWDLSNASYNGTPLNILRIGGQELSPSDIHFKPDGTKMYVIGGQGDDVNEYDLSTAWDFTTVSYLQNFRVNLQETNPNALFFKPDGTKMYVMGSSGDDVNEYNLSTAWDVSTASYAQNFSVSAQELGPTALFFKSDGTKMYITGTVGDDVNEYNLSTAWNISTASYVQTFSVSAQETAPTGLFFKPDGTKMYIIGSASDSIHAYDLSTAWDISTASFSYPGTNYFSVKAQEAFPTALFFKPDGTKMYVTGTSGDDVNEYNLSTAWDVSTASYAQTFSVSAQERNPNGLFFKPDGTKMYITGTSGDDVNEYNLSTAWDVSTASIVQAFPVYTQETNPRAVFFKPDGTKMYITGSSGDDVNEYNLSTAWNVSTASYAQNFAVGVQESAPQGLFFKPDGTKMYVMGFAGDDVNEYNLSTAWNISTASYAQNFSVGVQESVPQGLFFKPDGTKMYIIGGAADAIWSYDL